MSIDPLLTVLEAAQRSRLSRSMVYRLLKQGKLEAVRPPDCRRVLVKEGSLRRYLDAGQTSPATAN